MKHFTLLLRIVAVVILFQTLFFKFSGAAESKFIFSRLGVEPWGRWFAGLSELVAGAFLLVPRTQVLGAVAGVGVMVGAILSHLMVLGIVVQDDGGLLFSLACTVLICCLGILYRERDLIRPTLIWMETLVRGQAQPTRK